MHQSYAGRNKADGWLHQGFCSPKLYITDTQARPQGQSLFLPSALVGICSETNRDSTIPLIATLKVCPRRPVGRQIPVTFVVPGKILNEFISAFR